MFFSASSADPTRRTIGLARTRDLNGPWAVDPAPSVPPAEQVRNSSLYFEPSTQTWFLFTNHVGLTAAGGEFTDAVWVYWSKALDRWDPADKAVVLDGHNCRWSHAASASPGVLRRGDRLAVLYDAPGRQSTNHMNRDIRPGLAEPAAGRVEAAVTAKRSTSVDQIAVSCKLRGTLLLRSRCLFLVFR